MQKMRIGFSGIAISLFITTGIFALPTVILANGLHDQETATKSVNYNKNILTLKGKVSVEGYKIKDKNRESVPSKWDYATSSNRLITKYSDKGKDKSEDRNDDDIKALKNPPLPSVRLNLLSPVKTAKTSSTTKDAITGSQKISSTTKNATSEPKAGLPMISFNFDDSMETIYRLAIPIMDKYGFKTTQYVVTDRLGNKGGMTAQQVLELHDKGHEIGAHTKNHLHLLNLSADQAKKEIVGSKQDLIKLGINDVKTFAYTYGETNSTIKSIVEKEFEGARWTSFGTNDSNTDRYLLKTFNMRSNTTFVDVKSAIDKAKAEKKWLILVFHGIDTNDDYAVKSGMLDQIAQYVKSQNIPVVTNAQGLQVLK